VSVWLLLFIQGCSLRALGGRNKNPCGPDMVLLALCLYFLSLKTPNANHRIKDC